MSQTEQSDRVFGYDFQYDPDPRLCTTCQRETNGTHAELVYTGDRYPVNVCGDCFNHFAFDLIGDTSTIPDRNSKPHEVTIEEKSIRGVGFELYSIGLDVREGNRQRRTP